MINKITKGKIKELYSSNNKKEFRRWHTQLMGGLVGVATFFILPGVFKFFGFFFALFMFAISVRSTDNHFNMSVLIVVLCIFCLFTTSFITFDSSEPIAYNKYISYAQTGAEVVLVVAGVGVPLLLIVGGIWGFLRGQVEEGVSAIFKAFLIAGIGILLCFIFEMLKIDTGGTTSFTLDVWNEIISWIFEAPIQLYEGVANGINSSGIGLDLPNIPQNKHFRQPKESSDSDSGLGGSGGFTSIFSGFFDTESTASDPSVSSFLYGVPDALPLIMGFINIVSIPFFVKEKSEKILIAWFNHFGEEPRKTVKKREDKRLPYANFFMICYMVGILFAGFFIFLAYTNTYGTDARQDWKMIIFIYYVLMIFISVTFLQRYHNYTPATFFNTLKGSLLGLIGLYAMTRIFFHNEVDRSFSAIDMHSNGWYAINTFVFIAPAETFMFCLLIPCLIIAGIQIYEGKEPRSEAQKDLRMQIVRLDDMITVREVNLITQKEQLETWKYLDNKIPKQGEEGKTYSTRNRITNLNDSLDKTVKDLALLKRLRKQKIKEEKELRPEIPLAKLIENPIYLGIFIVGIIGASFLFATAHWFVIMNEISYAMFWAGGLAIIYFSGGFWFIIIGIKYGWLSAINCHAFYNTMTIFLVIIATA